MGDMTAEPHLLTPELRAAMTGAMLDLLDDLVTTMFCVKNAEGRGR